LGEKRGDLGEGEVASQYGSLTEDHQNMSGQKKKIGALKKGKSRRRRVNGKKSKERKRG